MLAHGLAMILSLLLGLALPALAADAPKPAPMDEKTRQQVLDHVLKRELNEINPTVAKAFMEMDIATVPKKLQKKVQARKLEIEAAVKIQGVKSRKRGSMLQIPASCSEDKGREKLDDFGIYSLAGYEEVFEDEIEKITKETNCSEKDMICEFSLKLFVDEKQKKPRRLGLHRNDPLMALVGKYRAGPKAGANTKFFGIGGITCMH